MKLHVCQSKSAIWAIHSRPVSIPTSAATIALGVNNCKYDNVNKYIQYMCDGAV